MLLSGRPSTNVDHVSHDSIIRSAAQAVDIENSYPYLGMTLSKDWIILIHQDSASNFVQYTFRRSSDGSIIRLEKDVLSGNHEIMNIAFDRSRYHNGLVDFDSSFFKNGYELSMGGPTYFVFYDETGRRVGETKLTLFVKPNPINEKVYKYLANQLIELINTYS